MLTSPSLNAFAPSAPTSSDSLAAFWRRHSVHGFHAEDQSLIPQNRTIDWDVEHALEHVWSFRSKQLASCLHQNLIPAPFVGNIAKADVFILMLNPGFNCANYLEDHRDGEYRRLFEANLRQEVDHCPVLNPTLTRSGGFQYWSRWFGPVIAGLAERTGISLNAAGTAVSQRVAIIQARPYHSVSDPGPWALRLPSAVAAKVWVQTELQRRAEANKAVVIVARASRFWDLREGKSIRVRPRSHVRMPHFTEAEVSTVVETIARGKDFM